MAHMMYLQNYLEGLQHVPPHLQQEFKIMRDLDEKVFEIIKQAQLQSTQYVANVRNMTKEERLTKLQQIQELFKKGKELSNDKISRAESTYELIDKQIRSLDADMHQFKKVLAGQVEQKKRKKALTESNTQNVSLESNEDPSIPATAALALALTNNPSEVLDMPVDPNEPTYCLCHQVSYGEMVACDNRECPIEWFHFGCVNLTSKPKGKWFCPNCSDDKRRKLTF